MLTELSVQALGVIDRAEVSLAGGCSAVTGETGAGKTLLVAAMGLLLGGRADRTLVRERASEALIEGRFVLPGGHPALVVLSDRGVLSSDGAETEIVVTRSISSDGRGKARVNGRLVPASLLGEIGPHLVEIAGQHEHHRLGSPAYQRALLDAYAGNGTVELARDVRELVRRVASERKAVEEVKAGVRERERELDVLRYEAKEIEAVRLEPGETARLIEEARRVEHAEAIALALESAQDRLDGDGGAQAQLAAAARSLQEVAEVDAGLGEIGERLDAAAIEVGDIAADLARRFVAPETGGLELLRSRIAEISRLRRKYGDEESDILGYLERAQDRIAELEGIDEGLDDREHEVIALEQRAAELARDLRARRSDAASRLEKDLVEALADLSLAGARVEIRIEPVDLYEGGSEEIRFLVSLNRGEPARPLAKVASGGELSRLSLALGLLTTTGSAGTLVFDEVDAGVGGATAHSIGRALSGLARTKNVQVLVVTHLPQVAAFADAQFRITKTVTGERTTSSVERITGGDRIDELSRMLAGLPESERAREHAQELLEMAGRS